LWAKLFNTQSFGGFPQVAQKNVLVVPGYENPKVFKRVPPEEAVLIYNATIVPNQKGFSKKPKWVFPGVLFVFARAVFK